MSNVTSIYGGKDPRELPFYTLSDVAHYLRIPSSTLSGWCGNKTYKVGGKLRRMKPLLRPDPTTRRLTFNNFAEAYVITSLTREFRIPLPRVRTALAALGGDRPLLDNVFHAGSGGIFVDVTSQALIDIGRPQGQVVIRQVVGESVKRIEFDAGKRPVRFHPWHDRMDEPLVVSIDARRAFGRPTVVNRGLKVEVVLDLHEAGESIESIARNYDMEVKLVRDVLKWGERGEAAAA